MNSELTRITVGAALSCLVPAAAFGAAPFVETQKLEAASAALADAFGQSVGIDGDTLVVGVPSDDTTAGLDAGSAIVYVRQGSDWVEQQTLEAGDAAAGDRFGIDVAIFGDTIAVGADLDDTSAGVDAGSVYVFLRSGTTWSQQQKLEASDAAADDFFGLSLDIDGDTIICGSSSDDTSAGLRAGSAYVFVRSGTTWSQQQKLEASDAAAEDLFGIDVAVSGDSVVIGSGSPPPTSAGAAYVFVRSGSTWSEQRKLTASDAASNDFFGDAVTIDDDTIVVGAPSKSSALGFFTGAAYVFTRTATVWSEQQVLLPDDQGATWFFGFDVDLEDDRAVIGSTGAETVLARTGATYVFERRGTRWSQRQKLAPSDGVDFGSFGTAVALSGGRVLCTDPTDDTSAGSDAGSSYAFEIPASFPASAILPGVSSGSAPGSEPDFATNGGLSGSGGDTVFIGGAGLGRSGVYRESGGTTEIIASANTAVPSGAGTFDTTFIDVDTEGDDTIFSCELGIFGIENNGPLFRIADLTTPTPGFPAFNLTDFGQVEVSDGDFYFQAGPTGSIRGIARDRNRTLISVVDTTTILPGSGATPTTFLELASGQGEIAFTVDTASGPAVLKASSDPIPALTLIADTTTLVPGAATAFTDFEEVSIRNGDVAFVGIGSAGIYRGDGTTPLRTVVDDGDSIPTSPTDTFGSFDLIGDLDNGEVAFIGFDGSGNVEGIFRATDTSPTINTLFDIATTLPGNTIPAGSFGETAIDGSTVIFVAEDSGGDFVGVFEVSVGSAATQKPIAQIPGALSWSLLGAPVAAGEEFVFFGVTDVNKRALYRASSTSGIEELVGNDVAIPGLLLLEDFFGYGVLDGSVVFDALDEDGDHAIYSIDEQSNISTEYGGAGVTLPGGGTLGAPLPPDVGGLGTDIIFSNPATGIYLDTGAGNPTVLVDDQTADPDGTGQLGPDFVLRSVRGNVFVFVAEDSSGTPGLYRQVLQNAPVLIANSNTPDPEGSMGGTLGGFSTTMRAAASGPDVAFVADDAASQPTLYLWSGGAITRRVMVGDALDGGGTIGSLTDATVAYEGGRFVFTAENDSSENGLYALTGATIQILADERTPSPTFTSFEDVALEGQRVFFSATDGGVRDVYTIDLDPPPAPLVPIGSTWPLVLFLIATADRLRRRGR